MPAEAGFYKSVRTEREATLPARLPLRDRITAHLKILPESGKRHSSLLCRIAQLSEVCFFGRVALEPVAGPTLFAAHTDVLVLAAQWQLEVAEPLDEDLARSALLNGVWVGIISPGRNHK